MEKKHHDNGYTINYENMAIGSIVLYSANAGMSAYLLDEKGCNVLAMHKCTRMQNIVDFYKIQGYKYIGYRHIGAFSLKSDSNAKFSEFQSDEIDLSTIRIENNSSTRRFRVIKGAQEIAFIKNGIDNIDISLIPCVSRFNEYIIIGIAIWTNLLYF